MFELWIDCILYLVIYSFIGWCCECVYCFLLNGKLVNRGFLYGPFCPIYGFGALSIIFALKGFPQTATAIFFGGMVVTSALEYVTSWAMEQLFDAKWWDYSKQKWNLHGRICLLNSTLFGILCVVLMFDLHPLVSSWLSPFNVDFKAGFAAALLLYFAADFGVTLYHVLGINLRLDRLEKIRFEIEEKYTQLDKKLDFAAFSERLRELDLKDELTERFQNMLKKNEFYERRLFDAFPNLRNRRHPEYLAVIQRRIQEAREEFRQEMRARKLEKQEKAAEIATGNQDMH